MGFNSGFKGLNYSNKFSKDESMTKRSDLLIQFICFNQFKLSTFHWDLCNNWKRSKESRWNPLAGEKISRFFGLTWCTYKIALLVIYVEWRVDSLIWFYLTAEGKRVTVIKCNELVFSVPLAQYYCIQQLFLKRTLPPDIVILLR